MELSSSAAPVDESISSARAAELSSAALVEDDAGHCGWGCWRPAFLQRFATSKSFLFWMCMAGGCQSFLINGLVNVCVSSIERRYELTSTDSGLVVGAFDIASFLFVLPISYLGGRRGACKPRWIGCGVLLLGLGSFIFSVPHFAAGLYQPEAEHQGTGTCSSISSEKLARNESCSLKDETVTAGFTLRSYRHVFFAAQFIMGVGGAPLYTLGTTFIDDSVTHKMQPIYSGILFSSVLFGPALGFIVGGQFLRLYVDFLIVSPKEVGMVPGSSVWVGAWWLGYIIIGFMLFIAAIPLLAFPAELPGAKALAATKEAEENATKSDDPDSEDETIPKPKVEKNEAISIAQSLKELPIAIKDLAKQYTFLFVCLEQSCEAMILAGFGAFIPKIIESQFALSPAMSALIVGALIVPCGSGGSYLGGFIIKHFRLKTQSILKLSMLFVGLSFISSFAFMIYCPNQDFAGITVPYSETFQSNNQQLKLNSDCNANCSCSVDSYNPICGVDNTLYYNPCFAGCTEAHKIESNNKSNKLSTVYSKCSCIKGIPEIVQNIDVMATKKNCESPCTYQLYFFVAMVFAFLLLQFLNSMPILSATLRSVPSNRRAFALGVQMIIWRLLGAIPGPIIFGSFIDNACLLWKLNKDDCKTKLSDDLGSCVFYDNFSFSRAMLGIMLIGKGLSFLFATLAWWLYKPPNKPAKTAEVAEVAPTTARLPSSKTKENYAYDNMAVDSS